jgi:5-methylcytosine-specific restriction endonuclease McrA
MIRSTPIPSTVTKAQAPTTIEKHIRMLTDRQLLNHVLLAARAERAMTTRVLHHLNEIERRKLYLELGYSSLFDYCTRRLKYSASAAGRRVQAARCIRRHLEVALLLYERELSLSTISLVAPVLTDHNKSSILERVRGKSHREVERVVSEYRPPIALRDRVRPVRVPVPRPVDVDRVVLERELERIAPGIRGATPGAGSVVTEQKLFVQFLASNDLIEKFEEVRDLLSNRCADGTFAEVLEVVLADFLERHSPSAKRERRKRCQTKENRQRDDHRGRASEEKNHSRRRAGTTNPSRQESRAIPSEIRDEVFARDEGQCTFVARDGTRCGSRRSLQIDHIRPFAAGGTHDPTNLRLLCAKHNRLAAEHTLGRHVMQRFWRKE